MINQHIGEESVYLKVSLRRLDKLCLNFCNGVRSTMGENEVYLPALFAAIYLFGSLLMSWKRKDKLAANRSWTGELLSTDILIWDYFFSATSHLNLKRSEKAELCAAATNMGERNKTWFDCKYPKGHSSNAMGDCFLLSCLPSLLMSTSLQACAYCLTSLCGAYPCHIFITVEETVPFPILVFTHHTIIILSLLHLSIRPSSPRVASRSLFNMLLLARLPIVILVKWKRNAKTNLLYYRNSFTLEVSF